MAWTALDLGLRGAAVGFALLVCAVLLRNWPFRTLTALRVAMGAGAAAYAISTAPFFPSGSFGWNTPFMILYAGLPVIFWLWAQAAFNDSFVLRPHHAAIWAFVTGLGVFAYCGWAISPAFSVISGRMFALASIAFALLAAAQSLRIWRTEAAVGCRHMLIAFLLAGTAFTIVNAASGLAAIPWPSVSFGFALGLVVLALFGVWAAYPQFTGQPALVGVVGVVRKKTAPRAQLSLPNASQPNHAWQRQLEHLMSVERVYRQESLSIGLLAVKLGMPEHRLRTLINEVLGHRNFNAFLNRYRIDEAKAALQDPGQIDVPVLTIALDAGFRSVTPFNRAFKADTGLTPTEFRQRALADRQTAHGDASIELPH